MSQAVVDFYSQAPKKRKPKSTTATYMVAWILVSQADGGDSRAAQHLDNRLHGTCSQELRISGLDDTVDRVFRARLASGAPALAKPKKKAPRRGSAKG